MPFLSPRATHRASQILYGVGQSRAGDEPVAPDWPDSSGLHGRAGGQTTTARNRFGGRELVHEEDHIGVRPNQPFGRQQNTSGRGVRDILAAGQFEQVVDVRVTPDRLVRAVQLQIHLRAGTACFPESGQIRRDLVRQSLGSCRVSQGLAHQADHRRQFRGPAAANADHGHAEFLQRLCHVILVPPDERQVDAQDDDLLARDRAARTDDCGRLHPGDNPAVLVNRRQTLGCVEPDHRIGGRRTQAKHVTGTDRHADRPRGHVEDLAERGSLGDRHIRPCQPNTNSSAGASEQTDRDNPDPAVHGLTVPPPSK